jgi:hypothetical protein
LQDGKLATSAKVSKNEIDWAKMTLQGGNGGEGDGQIDSSSTSSAAALAQSNMAQIDLMLYRFIEHR